MNPDISNKLLSFQIAHVLQLYESLLHNQCVLDASDTGTGKTYCTVALCKLLNLLPFIICPKSVISSWIDVCEKFDVKPFGIANYEMIKGCKYYTENLESVACPFFDKIEKNKIVNYKFQLPDNVIIIFDEAHRCKNINTNTSKLLLSAHNTNNKLILLSATLADKIELFKPFGIIFGLYHTTLGFGTWIKKQLLINKVTFNLMEKQGNELSEDQKKLYIINKSLFPKFGSRMKIKELGDLFPQNQVISQSYYLANHNEVAKLHEEINVAMADLKNKETRSDALGKIIRAKQRIELLKAPIFCDLAQEALDNNYSVAIFVNYVETMEHLCNLLNTACVIRGSQTLEERTANIKEFQDNNSNIIIAIIQAGGVGISLHDIHGDHPRMSIISPSWSGTDMVQALGRIHRAGAKTHSIQKIVFCAKTYEEQICKIIDAKFKTLAAINDCDMVGPKIPVEKFNEFNAAVEDSSFKYVGRRPDAK